jgi:polyhydroxyalkanoate synthesis regulator protein
MKTVNVRKYGNRKLYNEDRASYISMVGLSQIVAQGDRVMVTCDLTQDDITLETLARAYCERLKVGKVKSREEAQSAVESLIRGTTVRAETK